MIENQFCNNCKKLRTMHSIRTVSLSGERHAIQKINSCAYQYCDVNYL